jgi:serine phosphatase RsbU (regulator of sigma subunit)
MKYFKLILVGLILGFICLSILLSELNTGLEPMPTCENYTNLTYQYYNYTTGEITYKSSLHKVCNFNVDKVFK